MSTQDPRFKNPLVQACQMAPEMKQEVIEACMSSLEKYPSEYEHCAKVRQHLNKKNGVQFFPLPTTAFFPAVTKSFIFPVIPFIAAGSQRYN